MKYIRPVYGVGTPHLTWLRINHDWQEAMCSHGVCHLRVCMMSTKDMRMPCGAQYRISVMSTPLACFINADLCASSVQHMHP